MSQEWNDYEPVEVRLHTTELGRATLIGLQPSRKDWYSLAQEGIADMMGIPDHTKIELVDDFDANVKAMSVEDLGDLMGGLYIMYNDSPYFISNPPKTVPVKINISKNELIESKLTDLCNQAKTQIADILVGTKNENELELKCKPEGVIEKTIRSVIKGHINKASIIDYGYTETASKRKFDDVCNKMSFAILSSLRGEIKDSVDDIGMCFAKYKNTDNIFGVREISNRLNERDEYDQICDRAIGQEQSNLVVVLRNTAEKNGKKGGHKRVTIETTTIGYDKYGHQTGTTKKTQQIQLHPKVIDHVHRYKKLPAYPSRKGMYKYRRQHNPAATHDNVNHGTVNNINFYDDSSSDEVTQNFIHNETNSSSSSDDDDYTESASKIQSSFPPKSVKESMPKGVYMKSKLVRNKKCIRSVSGLTPKPQKSVKTTTKKKSKMRFDVDNSESISTQVAPRKLVKSVLIKNTLPSKNRRVRTDLHEKSPSSKFIGDTQSKKKKKKKKTTTTKKKSRKNVSPKINPADEAEAAIRAMFK